MKIPKYNENNVFSILRAYDFRKKKKKKNHALKQQWHIQLYFVLKDWDAAYTRSKQISTCFLLFPI